jgi:hypothetical protein
VWELGTSADPAAQAKENYEKRTAHPDDVNVGESTFIFVTTRRWSGKETWAAERRAENRWRDVRVCDADDIEAWLEDAASVHLWFSTRIGVVPSDCVDLENWWDQWQHATNPPLRAPFLLAGRDDIVTRIEERLASAPNIGIRAESQDESIAVLASIFDTSTTLDRDSMFARSVVVKTEAAWRHLSASRNALLLIPLFDATDVVSAALDNGHLVVVPLSTTDPEADDVVTVGPVLREPAATYLAESPSIDSATSWRLASLARRSMMAFRRTIARASSLRRPRWSQPAASTSTLASLFCGIWNDKHDGDRGFLAAISGTSYDAASAAMAPFTNDVDPLLRRRGSLWYLVSPEDAWLQLGRQVTRAQAEKFAALALDVATAPDPRWDLSPDKQWMSGVLLPPPMHSAALRRGIGETIGLLGSRESGGQLGGGSDALAGIAAQFVRDFFARLRSEPRLWSSTCDLLADLAEGAPDAFLAELEHALDGLPTPQHVFADSDGDVMFGPRSPHVELLWALERLAWSADHFPRVARILGRLDDIDPKGRLSNRPRATLRSLFLPWLPQTNASLDVRLSVLEAWSTAPSPALWSTLMSMLPEWHGIGHNTSRPRWRDWTPDRDVRATVGDVRRCASFAASNLIRLAGTDAGRWKELIEAFPRLLQEAQDTMLGTLASISLSAMPPETASAIWNALRDLVAHHRNFSDADWALPADRVNNIEGMLSRFEPVALVPRYGWLFGHRPELTDAHSRSLGFEEYNQEIERRRRKTAGEILTANGITGIIEVALACDIPHWLGVSLGKEMPIPSEDAFLVENLNHNIVARRALASGYLAGRADAMGEADGTAWLMAKYGDFAGAWTPADRAIMMTTLTPLPHIWSIVQNHEAIDQEYWKRINPYRIADEDAIVAARHHLRHGLAFAAVNLVSRQTSAADFTSTLAFEVLEAALFEPAADEPESDMFSYYVSQLLDALESASVDEFRLARIEWALLPVFSRFERKPKALARAVLNDPQLFVDAIIAVFKPKNSAPPNTPAEDSEEASKLASRAYDLLRAVRGLPGRADDGSIDAVKLRNWADRVRELLTEADRLEVGLEQLGELLGAYHGTGTDGVWPCEPVRDLVEEYRSSDLDRGIAIGLYNSRGVTSRSITEGGNQERHMANRYRESAAAVAARWPRTAGLLRSIGDSYDQEAQHHDQDVAIQEDLGR